MSNSRGNIQLFILDDEDNMVKILSKILTREGYQVTGFTEPQQALDALEEKKPDILVTDIAMPEIDGMEVLERARKLVPQLHVLIMTAYGTIEGAIKALKEGAYDYITKPFETKEFIDKVNKAAELLIARDISEAALSSEPEILTTPSIAVGDWEKELKRRLIGNSPLVEKVRSVILKVSNTDSSVLLRGESGTGKELVARAIHDVSKRSDERMVVINCAAIPEGLIESELFGHEPGAFTGAVDQKIGLIEAAHKGTLFLDEIGELPLNVQGRLLRVLQEHQIQRLGGINVIDVDVRVLAATNRNLDEMIQQGEFRADLFYRLNVIKMQLPPIRDRREDIPELAEALLARHCAKRNRAVKLTDEMVQLFREYSWPGNVRELENVIERLVVLSEDETPTLEMLPIEIQFGEEVAVPSGQRVTPMPTQFKDARSQFERRYLTDLLSKSAGSITEASRISGISRRNLYDKIQKLEINLSEFKNR
jgi:two-component system NtrC family response regulator